MLQENATNISTNTMANTDHKLVTRDGFIQNNEQAPLQPRGQLPIEEQTPTGSGRDSVPREEFDLHDNRERIPNDADESQ